jgi:hypothetical protein
VETAALAKPQAPVDFIALVTAKSAADLSFVAVVTAAAKVLVAPLV